jgi:hypothetical protein
MDIGCFQGTCLALFSCGKMVNPFSRSSFDLIILGNDLREIRMQINQSVGGKF